MIRNGCVWRQWFITNSPNQFLKYRGGCWNQKQIEMDRINIINHLRKTWSIAARQSWLAVLSVANVTYTLNKCHTNSPNQNPNNRFPRPKFMYICLTWWTSSATWSRLGIVALDTLEAWIRILAIFAGNLNWFTASGAIFNQTSQMIYFGRLMCNIFAQLLHQCNQILDRFGERVCDFIRHWKEEKERERERDDRMVSWMGD